MGVNRNADQPPGPTKITPAGGDPGDAACFGRAVSARSRRRRHNEPAKKPQGMRRLPVLLSRAVLMNRASAWARQAHEIMLDGEIAVLDDRGVTHIDDLQDAIAGHRPA